MKSPNFKFLKKSYSLGTEKIPLTFQKLFTVCFLLPVLLLSSCTGKQKERSALTVTVSILPQRWFVSQIAGPETDITINTLAGEGQNPHSYEPSARQIQYLAESDFWVLSGTEFETALRPKIEKQFPSLKIIDGTEGVVFRKLEEDDDHGHSHSNNIDRHTWLGEKPAVILAEHIRDAMCESDPENTARYKQNTDILIAKISEEFASLRNKLKPLEGSSVFVFHPSFGYFLDEFGIKQQAVETGGKEPTPKVLSELIKKAMAEKPSAIFVQAQFPVSAATTLADAVGAETIALDPLAENWLDNIKAMGESLIKKSGGAEETEK